MPALTQPFETYERPGLVVRIAQSNVRVYKGALCAVNASGHVIPMTPATAGLRFVGVSNESVDNSAGSAGAMGINVTKSGSFVFRAAAGFTPAQADIGKEVYAASDWEVQVATAGLTNAYKVGTIVALETTSSGAPGVRVRIDNHTV